MTANGERLDMWVIYERPRDFPQGFAVRRWDALTNTPDAMVRYVDTLEAARALVPYGLVMLEPHPTDDPCIRETWL
jgi:hypothetical protein